MKQMHTVPCAECPWRCYSIRGQLGGFEPEQLADSVRKGMIPVCHLRDTFCAGAASVMANDSIAPKEIKPGQRGAREMVKATGKREDTFIRPERFYVHHSHGKDYLPRLIRMMGLGK